MKSFISALFIFISVSLLAQGSYKVVFEGPQHNSISSLYATPQNEFVAIQFNYPFTSYNRFKVIYSDIYTLSNTYASDTANWGLNFNRPDTAMTANNLHFESGGGFLISGAGTYYSNIDTLIVHKRFNWMMKLDEMKNKLWEKFFPLPEEVSKTSKISDINVIALRSKNYLIAESIENDTNFSIINILLKEISPQGNCINTVLFDQGIGGYVNSLCYNHDSSAILLHVSDWELFDCSTGQGAFILDTANYEIIGKVCYRENGVGFTAPYDAMLDVNGDLIVAGTYSVNNISPPKRYLAVKRFDTIYQVTQEILLTDPDTITYPTYAAWSRCLDINAQGEICIAGSIDNALGFYTNYYDLIYLAKLNPELNLINERYIGRDAEYSVFCMTATSDGGIAVGGYQYDYLVNENEGDPFIIKTDAGLWLDVPQANEENVHRALVYPNPGNNELNIRTTVTDAVFRLYNLNGTLLIEQPVNQLITTLITSSLPQGAYMWTLSKQGQIIDKGKWIK